MATRSPKLAWKSANGCWTPNSDDRAGCPPPGHVPGCSRCCACCHQTYAIRSPSAASGQSRCLQPMCGQKWRLLIFFHLLVSSTERQSYAATPAACCHLQCGPVGCALWPPGPSSQRTLTGAVDVVFDSPLSVGLRFKARAQHPWPSILWGSLLTMRDPTLDEEAMSAPDAIHAVSSTSPAAAKLTSRLKTIV